MTKILFVCHGNICRSPMAEFLMRELVKEKGLENEFYIASAATSTEELGSPVYPPVRKILQARGIDCDAKRAVQVRASDYDKYDYIVCMDRNNLRNIKYIIPDDPEEKISLLMAYTGDARDVADPWCTRDFEAAERDINAGCEALLKEIAA